MMRRVCQARARGHRPLTRSYLASASNAARIHSTACASSDPSITTSKRMGRCAWARPAPASHQRAAWMTRARLAAVMLSAAEPKRPGARRRTSTKTRVAPSRHTRSISPRRQRTRRARVRSPCAARCDSASASAASPRACAAVPPRPTMGAPSGAGSFFMRDVASFLSSTPSLYVVATPIGHLADIGARALGVLREVDAIAAEDTRHSQRLLEAHGIRTPLFALHEHNEQSAASRVIALLAEGRHVALVSDAGTPGVSDPGARAVARVHAAGHPVVPVPGACAAIAALSASGLGETGFRFAGFLPPKSAARRATLAALVASPVALVLYESPHRIVECVDDLVAVFGEEREVVLARELTKLHEQIVRMPLADAPAWLAQDAN